MDVRKLQRWCPPADWLRLQTFDAHTGTVARVASIGRYSAVIPEVEGSAHITGRHEFFIDPADPLRNGFVLR